MFEKQVDYGLVRITSYLFTPPAKRYLNCCQKICWHQSNAQYQRSYPRGIDTVTMFFTAYGAGWIRLEGQRHLLKKGSLVMVPAHTPLEFGTDCDQVEPIWEVYFLKLEGDRIQDFTAKLWQDGFAVHTCPRPEEYLPLLRSLLENEEIFCRREKEISDQIRRICDQIVNDCLFEQESQQDPRVDEILQYLQTHCAEELSLEELSKRFYLSPNHLIRIFRQGTGYTPYEYAVRYRLMKAGELLQTTSAPINEIAEQLGYHNQSHFSAQFRKLFDMTPREYRRSFLML